MSDGKGFENSNCPIYRVHFTLTLKIYYIVLLKNPQSLDFPKFVQGKLALIVSLALYPFPSCYERS